MREEELIKALKEMDKKRVEELEQNSRKLFDAIMKIANERDKYKSLYQNEKEHTDTLKRIINRCVEEIYNLIDDCDSVIGNKESSIVSKNKLMLMQKEKIIKILDLLKEIK